MLEATEAAATRIRSLVQVPAARPATDKVLVELVAPMVIICKYIFSVD